MQVSAKSASLIGRKQELERIWVLYQSATARRTTVALVAGEPGIGKSSLLHAFTARAGRTGAAILHGGGSDAEGMPSYLPFLEALGTYIRFCPLRSLRKETEGLAPILASILPEMTQRLGELPAGSSLPVEQARLRLYEAVSLFLARIAADRPLVLLLDDLHWADSASLDLLVHVVRQQPESQLLILGAYRPGEAEQTPGFARTLVELTRLRALTTLTLGPLPAAECTSLAGHYLGGAITPEAGRLLWQQSEGNPFFAEELLRTWLETGNLVRSEQQWQWVAPITSLPDRTLPNTIVAVVRQRLNRLAASTLEYLRTASIIGRVFDSTLLAKASGHSPETIEASLLVAVRAHVISLLPDGTFSFSHDKIRETIYTDLPPAHRRLLHAQIGRSLEALAGQGSIQRLAQLAFHLSRSGDRAKGAHYSHAAGKEAMRTYAASEAVGHFQMALELLDPDDPHCGEWLLDLAEAAVPAGQETQALHAYEQALVCFTRTGDSLQAARAAHGMGKTHWRIEALLAAETAFRTALDYLENRLLPETVLTLVDLAAMLGLSLHRPTEGLQLSRQALVMATQLGDQRLVALAMRITGDLLVRENDLPGGIKLLTEALELAIVLDDPFEAVECSGHLFMPYLWQANVAKAEAASLTQLRFALRIHDPFLLRHVYSNLVATHALQGQWQAVEEKFALARRHVERMASPEPAAFLTMVYALSAYVHGEYATAVKSAEEGIALLRASIPEALVWYLGILGVFQIAVGQTRAALACLIELEELVARLPAGQLATSEALCYLTTAALAFEDRERLVRYYPLLVRFRGQYHDYLVDRLLGMIETRMGDLNAAAQSLAAAEKLIRGQGYLQLELALTLEAQADLELALSGPNRAGRARDLLGEAIEYCREYGNHPQELRLKARRRALPSRLGPQSRQALPAGLSTREADILRLVAAGNSNREIAATLYLSEKTIANHLTSIFNKLGVDNRAAAATFAVRNGLSSPEANP